MNEARIFERASMSIGAATPPMAKRVDVTERAFKEEDAPQKNSASLKRHFESVPYKKRGILLAAAIAVPAIAAPGDFGALPGDATQTGDDFATRVMVDAALPFERPGQSFPGSAFYYLGDPPEDALLALPTTDAFDTGAEGDRELGAAIDAGPPARPFFSSTAGQGHLRALDCMAQAIWYEAASESTAGQRAVAQVVLNRVAHPTWPGSVCGVVYEGSQRSTGCQFSFTCDGSLSRRARGASWEKARRLASEALSGSVYAPIGHATHYHTLWVSPYWASSLDHVGTIGAHRFYRNRGNAGEKSAFTGSYAGIEPIVSGRNTAAKPASAAIAGAFGSDLPASQNADGGRTTQVVAPEQPETDTAVSIPRYSDPDLEGSGAIKSDYSNAGQWKKRPEENSADQQE